MKKYFSVLGIILSVISLSVLTATKGYSDNLFEATLTGSSALSYSKEVEAKISIKDNGKVELSIKGLRAYLDNKLVSQNSVLVIETEVNESAKTYSKSFTITDGKAEEEFTLEDLSKDDKLEILSVAVNKGTSTTPTPTVTISPTPTGTSTATPTVTASPTPTGTATATPTVTASPTPAGSSTAAFMVSATTTTSDTILVPGGLISTSTTPSLTPVATASPTPSATASPTPVSSPTETPSIINATVEIKPETINLKSNGKFKAFITLPSPYSVNNIDVDTVECEGAQASDGKVDKNRFSATFRIQDLDLGFDIKFHKSRKDKKVEVTLDVTGELKDGTKFKGSDTVKIKGKKRGDDDDDDDNDDDDHGKNKHD
ncbi:MAG: hypothetical protein HW406_1873 [Candidatus Brocadiaceae bacterium]|nr:hypothetical protein [Candidatus Brocadiaceae bacterium]